MTSERARAITLENENELLKPYIDRIDIQIERAARKGLYFIETSCFSYKTAKLLAIYYNKVGFSVSIEDSFFWKEIMMAPDFRKYLRIHW